jgi:hypothetical protein
MAKVKRLQDELLRRRVWRTDRESGKRFTRTIKVKTVRNIVTSYFRSMNVEAMERHGVPAIDPFPANLRWPKEGRVGHRRGTGRHRGVAVAGPSSGLRRCLDPCRSPFPASPSIIPDGEISPVRLETKAFPRGAFPRLTWLKRWRAYAT